MLPCQLLHVQDIFWSIPIPGLTSQDELEGNRRHEDWMPKLKATDLN